MVLRKAPGGLGRRTDLLFTSLVLVAGACLLFVRLDDMYLWQDEAETAIVSRHLLAYGLPLSTNGVDWVQQAGQPFIEFTGNYVWVYHSWLQYVLTAVAFALLGATTFAARVPFVLVGLATLWFFHGFVARWVAEQRVARVATILLALCVPFLLLVRQCRYYVLAAFFTLLVVDAYLRLRSGERWAVPYMAISGVLLYHSHYGAFFPTVAALAMHLLAWPDRRKFLRSGLVALSLLVLLVLPWALFMRVWDRGEPLRLDRMVAHVGQHVVYITAWVVPLVVTLPWLFSLLPWEKRFGRTPGAPRPWLSAAGLRFCEVVGLVTAVNILTLAASAAFDWAFFRYLAHLIPLLLAVVAVAVVWIVQHSPVVGHGVLAVLVTSNALHMLPYALPGVRDVDWVAVWPSSPAFQALDDVWSKARCFRSDAWMYAQELTHSYEGPNEGLVAYLAAEARPGQTLLVNYEDLPLMFYTELRVSGGLGGHGLEEGGQPDWVIDRRHGPYRDRLAAIVAGGSYERIELLYPDIRWENRPEPGSHHYLTVGSKDRVVVYRRVGD